MYRISNNLTHDNMQYHLRNREFMLNESQNRISGQTRILNLRDDPIGAAHASRYQSYLARLERYEKNIEYAQSNWRIAENFMRQSVDILQRIRELSIQGANGSYSGEDRQHMAFEVDQMLQELIQIGNSRDLEGLSLFSGTRTQLEPFRALMGNVAGSGQSMVTQVEYIGGISSRRTEVSERDRIDLDVPGNYVFWAENQQIFSAVDAADYQVAVDSNIYVDGHAIELIVGDTLGAIVTKINDSPAAVEANIDPITNGIVLQTTNPHQITLEDDNNVLRDIGLIVDFGGETSPPERFGGSLFDVVIRLRDAMLSNDAETIGGRSLDGIDEAIENVLSYISEFGARDSRVSTIYQRNQRNYIDLAAHYSTIVDPNLAQEIVDLRILEQTHQAALATTARIIPNTLLDFIR